MRRLALLLALLCCASAANAADRVVLIVSAASPVTRLDSVELRKLYLGFTVTREGRALRALRNLSDRTLDDIFLQNVVSMSGRIYEQRLIASTLHQGRPRPEEIRDSAQLLAAIAEDPLAVSIAWQSAVADNPRLRVLRVLWQE